MANDDFLGSMMVRQEKADYEKQFSGNNGELILSSISNMPDVYSKDDAEECLKTLQAVTKILRAVGEYEERISALVKLEIAAFEKIAEYADSGGDVSGIKNVEKRYKDALNVFLSISKEEREEAANEAIRISGSFVSHVCRMYSERRDEKYSEKLSSEVSKLVEEYEAEGYACVDLLRGSGSYPKTKAQAKVYDAMKNRAKDALLNKGAVGIGHEMYVNPEQATNDEIAKAINIRCKSVLRDLAKINKLVYLRNLSEIPNGSEFSSVMKIIDCHREQICKELQ